MEREDPVLEQGTKGKKQQQARIQDETQKAILMSKRERAAQEYKNQNFQGVQR